MFSRNAAFGVETHHPDALRLSFVTAGPAELAEAVRRLAAALDAT